MLQNSVCHHHRIPMVGMQIIFIGSFCYFIVLILSISCYLRNSFNVGPAHIIGFSSEFYYYTEYGFDQIVNQYQWLEQDLIVTKRKKKIQYMIFFLII